jgi:hypothetical protein
MALPPKMRVNIPANPKGLLELANKIFVKHDADAAASPLLSLQDIDLVAEQTKIATALVKHNEAENLRLQMEQAYKERDFLMQNTEKVIKNSRDLLTAIHRANMKRLGEWGFTVDHTPKAKKTVAPAAAATTTPPTNP